MKKAVLIALLLTLLTPLAYAAEINIQTLDYHQVEIFVIKSDVYYLLESFRGEADGDGMFTVTTTTDESTVDLLVKIKWNGNDVTTEKFEDLSTSSPIEITLPEGIEKEETVEETTQEETTDSEEEQITPEETENADVANLEIETTDSEEEQSARLTGFSIFGDREGEKSSKIYWIIGFALLGGIVALMLLKRNLSSSNKIKINVQKKDTDREIAAAEARIAQAQEMINNIKNAKKIEEAEKKLKEDQEALSKLRKGQTSETPKETTNPNKPFEYEND